MLYLDLSFVYTIYLWFTNMELNVHTKKNKNRYAGLLSGSTPSIIGNRTMQKAAPDRLATTIHERYLGYTI